MASSRKPCRYIKGQCPYGDRCMFGHNDDTRQLDYGPTGNCVPTVPRADISTRVFNNVKSGPLCKYYESGSCVYGDSCRNRHETPIVSANSICKYYVSGNCSYGTTCRFVHSTTPISSAASLNHSSPVFVSSMSLSVINRI